VKGLQLMHLPTCEGAAVHPKGDVAGGHEGLDEVWAIMEL
jgi:hypothetical protein